MVPKGLPRSDESVYIPDGASHLIKTPMARDGHAMVFVCHDIAALHRRGEATTKHKARKDLRDTLVAEANAPSVQIGLNLIHDMSSAGSFTDPYNNWGGPEPLVGAAGLSQIQNERDALKIAASLLRPHDFPTLDIWEGP